MFPSVPGYKRRSDITKVKVYFVCLDAMWHFVGSHVLEGNILHEVVDGISVEYDLRGVNHTKHFWHHPLASPVVII